MPGVKRNDRSMTVKSLAWEDDLRREWLPTPVLLPGEFHGQRSLEGTVHGVAKSWTWLGD